MRWPMGFASLSLHCGALASHLSAAPAANAAWLCSVVASGLLVAALAKSRVEAGAHPDDGELCLAVIPAVAQLESSCTDKAPLARSPRPGHRETTHRIQGSRSRSAPTPTRRAGVREAAGSPRCSAETITVHAARP